MKIFCEKASEICNKVQYKEATFLEKIKLTLHLLYCRTCAKYTKKNTRFTILCDKANLHIISEKEKEAMKKELKKRL